MYACPYSMRPFRTWQDKFSIFLEQSMKLCQTCGQPVAEEITTCPSCGSEVREGREYIDDYRIDKVLHESHASILCRAVKEGEEKPTMIRIFTPQSGVNEEVADRLRQELEELKSFRTITL